MTPTLDSQPTCLPFRVTDRLLREGRLSELAVCVIDELHMIRDPDRGAALETSITKLLFSPAGRDVQVRFCTVDSQVVGSSCCTVPRMLS
jgi:superfamily II helicase